MLARLPAELTPLRAIATTTTTTTTVSLGRLVAVSPLPLPLFRCPCSINAILIAANIGARTCPAFKILR